MTLALDMSTERDVLQSKLRRLEHEMAELRSSDNGGEVSLIELRSVKHELERKLAEQEDELADMQQEAHELEMAKLKLQMEVDKLRQKTQKDVELHERELDEMRDSSARKARGYESRISELEEELNEAYQAKREAERRLLNHKDAEPTRDHEHEKELKSTIRKLRVLLSDMQAQTEKQREQGGGKSRVRALETQVEDLQSSLTATLKSKQSLETELQEAQTQASATSKARVEAEDKLSRVNREKTDIENEKEDLDDEIHELMKRYQALLSQSSVTAITLRDQAEQLSTLEDSKRRMQDEIDSLTSRLNHVDAHCVPKERLTIIESKCLELEQKLEYEKSLRARYENQALRARDSSERLEDEITKMQSKLLEEERRSKQLQTQMNRTLDEYDELGKKEIERTQSIASLNQRIEVYDAEVHQLQTELKSAQKRIEYLQSSLEQSAISDMEDGDYSSDTEDDDDDYS